MPLEIGAIREHNLPTIGKVKIRHISIGDIEAAEEYVESVTDIDKPEYFVDFLLGRLIVSPDGYNDVNAIPEDDQKALVPFLIQDLGISEEINFDKANLSAPIPYGAIYEAYRQKMKTLSEEILSSFGHGIKIGGAVADSVIVTGDTNVVISGDGIPRIDKDVEPGKRILSEEQAFERIGGAARLVYEQIKIDIEQARKESSQIHTLMLVLIGAGAGLILVGVILLYTNQITAGTVSLVSSIVSEAIAMLFFKKDGELRKRVSRHHDQLLEVQKILTMMDIAETIIDKSIRDDMKRQIIYKSLGIDAPIS